MTMQHIVEESGHEIGEMSILCSKDKSLSSHPGNRLFRKSIEEAIPLYQEAADKATKMKITKNIVELLQSKHGCTFVKFDTHSSSWAELSRTEARDKVGHALRFAIKGNTSNKQSSRRRSTSAKKKTKRRSAPRKALPCFSAPQSSLSDVSTRISSVSPLPTTSETLSSRVSSPVTEDTVQMARENIDQMFERQQEILKSWHPHSSPCSHPEEEQASIKPCEVVSMMEPLDLQIASQHEVTDLFGAGELDFLTDGSEYSTHSETPRSYGDYLEDRLWDFALDGIVSL